jgi:integrase
VHYLRVLLDEPIKRHAQRRDDGLPYKKYAEATVRKFYFALKRSVESYSRTHRIPIDTTLFVMEKGFVPSAWAGRRDRRLAEGEEHQLYAAGLQRGDFTYTTEDWKHIIGFALETAMRQQEITLAKWKDVFSAGEKLKIPKENSKTQQERVVLLSIKARSILAAQKATCPKGESRIFHQTPDADAVCEAFARLTNRAKIEDLHFHDLRHEATSRLCESGQLQQMAIMEMTGHKTMLAFRGYVHLLNHEKSVRLD